MTLYNVQTVPTTLCARKWDNEHFRGHLQRLQGIKTTASDIYRIQNSNRKLLDECNRLRNHNPKKLALERLQSNETARENRSLVSRINSASRSLNRSLSTSAIPLKKSLNFDARKKEMIRLTMENFGMSKRIRSQQSKYGVKDFKKHNQVTNYFVNQISKFKPLRARTSSVKDLRNTSSMMMNSDTQTKKFLSTSRMQDTLNTTWQHSKNGENKSKTQKNFSTERQQTVPQESDVLHKCEAKISDCNCLVEILLDKAEFKIVAYDVENLTIKTIRLPRNRGKEMLLKYSGDYDLFIQELYFQNGNLKHKYITKTATFVKRDTSDEEDSSAKVDRKEGDGNEQLEREENKSYEDANDFEPEVETDEMKKKTQPNEEPNSNKELKDQQPNEENNSENMKVKPEGLEAEEDQNKETNIEENHQNERRSSASEGSDKAKSRPVSGLSLENKSASNRDPKSEMPTEDGMNVLVSKYLDQHAQQNGSEERSLISKSIINQNSHETSNLNESKSFSEAVRHSVTSGNFNSRLVLNTNHSKNGSGVKKSNRGSLKH